MSADVAPPRRADLPETGTPAHLMGVGGAGMRGLALLLAEAGYPVTGCDRSDPGELEELAGWGVEVREGHDAAHLEGIGLLIRSAAVPEDHPEVEAARGREIPVWTRAAALGALVNDRTLVGVAGAHGKTTITAMAALACEAAGLDPSAAVGGRVPRWPGHARAGDGELAIVEADEYDRSFLQLDPHLALVSAVEEEHLESYGTMDELRAAYWLFAGRAASRLGVVVCADDPGARALGNRVEGALSYGFSAAADYRVERLPGTGETPAGSLARLTGPDGRLEFELSAPGGHNLQNAAGALTAALRVGADPSSLARALVGFEGVDRRFQRLADREGIAVVDDYAHHPSEVRAAVAAARSLFPGRRLVAVFQPHLFSRTERFAEEFAAALEEADEALVLPIFPAREEPIPGVTSELIVRTPGSSARLAEPGEATEAVASALGGPPAVFLFLGAGDITDLARQAGSEVDRDAVGA